MSHPRRWLSSELFLFKRILVFFLSDTVCDKTLVNVYCRDPNLWMVKCRIGEEKATVMHMMRKYIAYQYSNEPLQIKSVIAPEGVKGYIYVEAFKQPHVKQAIMNVSNLRMGQWTQQVQFVFT